MNRQEPKARKIQMERHLVDALVERHKVPPLGAEAVGEQLGRAIVDPRSFLVPLPEDQAAPDDGMEPAVGKGSRDDGHVRVLKVADDVAFPRSPRDKPNLATRADDPPRR